ncbi:MAG TPA: NAD(P)/FAD-dependent oxidoreductase [candidate division UBP10 bacterium]|nr:NAD(P)/FAD-dependent oxidoreductase [Candidatus Binatota bacterium]
MTDRIPQQPVDPITESDEQIAEALASASIPAILMSIVHLEGSLQAVADLARPGPAVLGEQQGGMADEDKARVRTAALDALRAYRDRGCTLPSSPSTETIHEMMNLMVGEEVPVDYVAMMTEELALDGGDPRRVGWTRPLPDKLKQDFPVVIIGAGMSGLLTAYRLQEAGIPFTVVEKNATVGGTWLENSYPGCRVDIPNHFYCYSFEPNSEWTRYFAERDELLDYFEQFTDRHDLREHVRFNTEVTRAVFDEDTGRWRVGLRRVDGSEDELDAAVVVSAVGQLSRPRIPAFEGLDDFEGVGFHSARWQHDVELEGKRVAVVGTGASSLQLVPELAKVAGKLEVFQRSPCWMTWNADYHRETSEGKKWLLRHVPFYGRWYRFLLFWPGSDGLMPMLVVDPEWEHPERSVSESNDMLREVFTEYIRGQVGEDPELLAKVIPDYPPFGKRMLQDNGSWFGALKQDNVDLVTDGIKRVTATGIECEDGSQHELDVIVFATGFHANRFLWPMDIIGRDGVELSEAWGDDPSAYLGITVPGFPNMFCLYGPGTNLAHAGSIIFHSECQVRYIMGCVREMVEKGLSTMDVRREVHDDYVARFDAEHERKVWAHPGMNSWYKNSRGRVTTTSPWLLLDYWRWTMQPDFSDYELR